MDWDDEDYNEYKNRDNASQQDGFMPDKSTGGDFDPMDMVNPVSAYFFLSNDAQDEIIRTSRKKVKSLSFGHRFMGEIYDSCPECFSLDTEGAVYSKDDGYW